MDKSAEYCETCGLFERLCEGVSKLKPEEYVLAAAREVKKLVRGESVDRFPFPPGIDHSGLAQSTVERSRHSIEDSQAPIQATRVMASVHHKRPTTQQLLVAYYFAAMLTPTVPFRAPNPSRRMLLRPAAAISFVNNAEMIFNSPTPEGKKELLRACACTPGTHAPLFLSPDDRLISTRPSCISISDWKYLTKLYFLALLEASVESELIKCSLNMTSTSCGPTDTEVGGMRAHGQWDYGDCMNHFCWFVCGLAEGMLWEGWDRGIVGHEVTEQEQEALDSGFRYQGEKLRAVQRETKKIEKYTASLLARGNKWNREYGNWMLGFMENRAKQDKRFEEIRDKISREFALKESESETSNKEEVAMAREGSMSAQSEVGGTLYG